MESSCRCCDSGLSQTSGHGTDACPVSRTKAVSVELQTVKALLTEIALRRPEPGTYRFCADGTCDVVYFDEAGHIFTTKDLRVPVWQKEPFGARMICYCSVFWVSSIGVSASTRTVS